MTDRRNRRVQRQEFARRLAQELGTDGVPTSPSQPGNGVTAQEPVVQSLDDLISSGEEVIREEHRRILSQPFV